MANSKGTNKKTIKPRKYDIKYDGMSKYTAKIYKQLNEINNKYPYTMLKYAQRLVTM